MGCATWSSLKETKKTKVSRYTGIAMLRRPKRNSVVIIF